MGGAAVRRRLQVGGEVLGDKVGRHGHADLRGRSMSGSFKEKSSPLPRQKKKQVRSAPLWSAKMKGLARPGVQRGV